MSTQRELLEKAEALRAAGWFNRDEHPGRWYLTRRGSTLETTFDEACKIQKRRDASKKGAATQLAPESTPKPFDRVEYDAIFAFGRTLGYWWRGVGDGRYQTMRSDGSVSLTFGPVHEGDRGYFDDLCAMSRPKETA